VNTSAFEFADYKLFKKPGPMTIEDIQQMCKSHPAVTQDIKWGHDLCFLIGGKMFLVVGLDEVPVTASFKVTDEEFEELTGREGFKPAPYMAKHKWVYVDDINKVNKKDWTFFIKQSYGLIKSKLPKKKLKELGLDE
jgi:predicted DNA-binding protein (MmcQ/YjbR family)